MWSTTDKLYALITALKLGGEYQKEISLSKKLGLSVSLITED